LLKNAQRQTCGTGQENRRRTPLATAGVMLNAISLLKDDHHRISGLFELFADSDQLEEKLTLFQQIKDELEQHSFLEEKIFYPALSKFYELTDLIDTSYEELDEMEDLAEDIEQMEPDTEDLATSEDGGNFIEEPSAEQSAVTNRYDEAVEELRLMFQRHMDQVEREIFPDARDLLDPDELENLATEMNEVRTIGKAA